MTQAFDATTPSFRAPPALAASWPARALGWGLTWLRRLLTDGLTADAFLVLSGGASVAVLLRRPDGAYVVVARDPRCEAHDGAVYREPELARDAIARGTRGEVTLAPVWYS